MIERRSEILLHSKGGGIMRIAAWVSQAVGLFITLLGSWLLLKGLFITDEEIKALTDLPISASGSSFTSDGPLATVPDLKKLEDYKDLYLDLHKAERRKGRIALWFFIVGFALQVVGIILAALPICERA